jgi:DNA mismatch repair protein PMS2
MATIKAIEGRSVHQIQSGQVIVDLISVVKELVENSLDAGATSIEIRFKNQGLESVEVQDTGKGIPPEDFETVALKHYTSKLSTYEDLTSLDTFGFRGEALSSLCALSKFHIITARAEDGAVGRKLDFETSGQLKGNSVIAAQKGTTVSVENLFYNLPVRRKELEKNIKREYNKVVAHLHAYACISVGVRFAVTNQMPKAKKITVFSTKANTTTKENITNVFGAKTILALVKLDLHLEMEPSNGPSTQSARNWSTQTIDRSREVHVQGYISKPVFGEGRQAPDRQMFFVNSRPCGLPQITKAVNEVYKSFNVSQVPFVFANLVMDTNAYDVNVSPDKRSIMLHDQTTLLESLKASLTELFEQTDHTVPQSQLPDRKLPSYKPLTVPQRPSADKKSTPQQSDDGSDEDARPPQRNRPSRSPLIAESAKSASLIDTWTGRDLEARAGTPAKKLTATGVSKDKESLVKTMQESADPSEDNRAGNRQLPGPEIPTDDGETVSGSNQDENASHIEQDMQQQVHLPVADPEHPDPMGSRYDDLFSQRPGRVPTAVEQFNALMDRRRSPQPADADALINDAPVVEAASEPDTKPQSDIATIIPALQKGTPGPVQNAFDRMRPKRTPLQTAEVTIGDKTTTTVIGSSPPYKKRRVHQPNNSQSIAAFGGSPLLARGLRTFAAPGSQLDLDGSGPPPDLRTSAQPFQESDEEDAAEEDEVHNKALHESRIRSLNKLARPAPRPSDPVTSDPLDSLIPAPADDDEYDEDYIDEHEKKLQEDEKVARLIQEAEIAAAQPSDETLRRASQVLKNGGSRKESTLQLAQYVKTSIDDIRRLLPRLPAGLPFDGHDPATGGENNIVKDDIDTSEAESRLSLTVSKVDFERMHIIGQFNLGFVLAVRPRTSDKDEDQLFIIDQHAADEKYNYERLQRTVTLQNQRLVRPKLLDLTAIEEEVILNNTDALKANGFEVEITSDIADEDDEDDAARRCRLITLPISGGKTFDLSDLEELLHLLSEAPAGSSEIPRPKKVQKMLAMRACRSSIMVGKTLTLKQMKKVVRHMGEMEKPWNCPHGRPTMRHLAGLGSWSGWSEGDLIDAEDADPDASVPSRPVSWAQWLKDRE